MVEKLCQYESSKESESSEDDEKDIYQAVKIAPDVDVTDLQIQKLHYDMSRFERET